MTIARFCLLLLGLVSCLGCLGHEVRPALLKLTQTAPGGWEVLFKQPQIQGRFLNLSVSTNCSQASEPERVIGTTAIQETYQLDCGADKLSRVTMPGLENTLVDTMVTLETPEWENRELPDQRV